MSIELGRLNIKIEDSDSFQNAIDTIRTLSSNTEKALNTLREYLLDKGCDIAKDKLEFYLYTSPNRDMQTGALYGSIRVEHDQGSKNVGYIVAGYPGDSNGKYSYAVYYEFGYGTGSYYENGKLLKTDLAIARRMRTGTLGKGTGRTKSHKHANEIYQSEGRNIYRKAEDSNIISNKSGGEFFGFVYKDERTGKFYTSHGQNPRPFMYGTLSKLVEMAEKDGSQFVAKIIVNGG